MGREGSMERSGGVLCRYFFQQMLLEGDDNGAQTPLEELTSALLLSARPTLGELRRKFPFEGRYHFRLQLPLPADGDDTSATYCWRDLLDEYRALPVDSSGEIRVKVLQLSAQTEDGRVETPTPAVDEELVDVAEDRQFGEFFLRQQASSAHTGAENAGFPMPRPTASAQDMSSVLFGVKKALASKMKGSIMAQTLQKHSAQMWDKVVGTVGGGATAGSNAAPTAAALEQLAKLVGAMKTPLHAGTRDHLELLQRLWASCFDPQPFVASGAGWKRLGFRYGDPMRELQFLLPLQCLVFFHEVHRTAALPILNDQNGHEAYEYALVSAKIAFLLADLLQLRDGGCLGAERPFWRLFEDPMGFFELFCVCFRAFDASWKLNAAEVKAVDVHFHLNYVAEFAQELLRRGPDSVASLVEYAYQLQNW